MLDSTAAAAITVTDMAKRVSLSRARFYELVDARFFAPPVFLLSTRRPVYFGEMVDRNVLAKETGIGVDGQIRVFYDRAEPTCAPTTKSSPGKKRKPHARRGKQQQSDLGQRLVSALKQLGLSDVDDDQALAAVEAVFPGGTAGVAEGDLIRAVFRHLRVSASAR